MIEGVVRIRRCLICQEHPEFGIGLLICQECIVKYAKVGDTVRLEAIGTFEHPIVRFYVNSTLVLKIVDGVKTILKERP